MKYSIKFSREAIDNLDLLNVADRRLFLRIFRKIESLTDSPYEGKPLVGNHKGEYSLRIGSYRVVYMIDETDHIIYVFTAKHRKHFY